MRRVVFVCLLTCLIYQVLPASISALEESVDKASGKEKLNLLLELTDSLFNISPERVPSLLDTLANLNEQYGNWETELKLYLLSAREAVRTEDLSAGEELYLTSLDLLKGKKDLQYTGEIFKKLASIAEQTGDLKKAQIYYFAALDFFENIDNKYEIAECYNLIGINFELLNDYGQALEYYLESLKLFEEISDQIGISTSLNNIGNIYNNLEDYDRALDYYIRSMEIDKELGLNKGVSLSYNNIGNIYSTRKEYDRALEYYHKALKIGFENNDPNTIATSYNNIAIVYFELGDYDLTESNYLQALAISEQENDWWAISNTSNNLAELYYHLGDYKKSFDYVNRGLQVAREIYANDLLLESFKILSDLNYIEGSYRDALQYFRRYEALKDSLISTSINQILSLQTRYETQKKEKEIQILKTEREHHNFVRNFLIIAISFVLLIIVLLYYLYQEKRKENEIRKITEKKLFESELKFRTLAENIKTAIYTIGEDGYFHYANLMALKICGYSEKEMYDMKFFDLISPEFKKVVKNRGFDRLKGGNPVSNYEFKIVTGSGEEKWLEISNGRTIINGKPFILGTANDITDRKKTEEELIKSEKRYRSLQNNVPIGIFRSTPDDRLVSINSALLKMFGYKSESELLQLSASELFASAEERQNLMRILESERVVEDLEIRLKRKDGSVFWGSFNVRAVFENGSWIYLDGIIKDISDRKRSDMIREVIFEIANVLNTNEELPDVYRIIHTQLGKVIDVTNFYIALYEKETNIVSSPYYIDELRTQVPEPQQMGNGITAHVIKTGRSLYLTVEKRKKLIEKGIIPAANWKSKIWLGVPLKIGNEVIGAMAVQSYKRSDVYSRDDLDILEFVSDQIAMAITKKRAENALKTSEQFNRAIIDSSPLGISARDKHGTLIIANEAWRKIWSKNKEELYEDFRKREKLKFDERDDYLGTYRQEVENIYKNGGEVFVPEIKLKGKTKDEAEKWISQYFYAIQDVNGEVDKVVIITEDITQRKISEGKIKSSLREKDILLKEVYHRVKNNMQVISSLLKLQSQHTSDQKAIDMLRESQNRVRSMSLIHEKLYLSENLEKIDFANYIRSLTTFLFSSFSINPNNVKLQVEVRDVYLDINKAIPCGLMVNELVSNALKHGFPLGRKGVILISLAVTNDYYQLTVSNDGLPFPDDLNFKESKSLGLQLVNALTEQLHGKIELETEPQTAFKINFKVNPEVLL
ncbi:MAG: PAS domain S-box protein [Candidatus Cloacimonetes bacterium]|nr:PAS domain S-box protein [Candidatus Cloacimonadota bacterium]